MITRTELKTFLDINSTDYDSVLDIIIDGVKKQAENYCKNVLIENTACEEIIDIEEVMEADGFISLKNRVNLSNIKVYYNDGTDSVPVWKLEDTDDYVANAKQGTIETNIHTATKITYTAGYKAADIPDDLKLACLKLASAYFNKRKSEGQSSEGADGANVTFADSMSSEIKGLLQPYKSIKV